MNNEAGKGDNYRPVDVKKYDNNYESIFNPPICEVCNTKLTQAKIGTQIFYCTNNECAWYNTWVDYKGD